jgi:hypothetical protein
MSEKPEVQENPYKDYYIKIQENYIGELLGKNIDLEAKLNLSLSQNKLINDKVLELSSTQEVNTSLQQTIEIITSNKEAFEKQNSELKEQLKVARSERQLAQEELAGLKAKYPQKKRGRPKKVSLVNNGKYNKNKEIINSI